MKIGEHAVADLEFVRRADEDVRGSGTCDHLAEARCDRLKRAHRRRADADDAPAARLAFPDRFGRLRRDAEVFGVLQFSDGYFPGGGDNRADDVAEKAVSSF